MRDVLRVDRVDEWREVHHLVAFEAGQHDRQIVGRLGAEADGRPRLEMQVHVRLELDRAVDQPVACRHDDPPAAGLAAGGDRLVEGPPAVGGAVAHGAIVGDGKIAIRKRRRLDLGQDAGNGVPADGVGGNRRRINRQHAGANQSKNERKQTSHPHGRSPRNCDWSRRPFAADAADDHRWKLGRSEQQSLSRSSSAQICAICGETSARVAKNEPLVLQPRRTKVHQQSPFTLCCLQIVDRLRLVFRNELVDGFGLQDD